LTSRLLHKNVKIKIYIFTCCFVWEGILISRVKGRTQIEDVWEHGASGVFGPKKDEVMGGWRKLHNEELHNLYSSPDIIAMIKSRRMRWAGYIVPMVEVRNAYKVSVGNLGGNRPFRRPSRNLEDNIKIYL
jgi:hypothetical protein